MRMGVIAWSPLAGGWLTGRYRKDSELPVTRRAGRIPQRFDMSLPGNQAKLEAAEQLPAGHPLPGPRCGKPR